MSFTKIELPKHLNGDLYLGDNLEVMKSLSSSSIDLIYGDPPFFSGRNYSAESKVDVGEVREFTDTFNTLNDYLKYLYIRLIEMKRLLKNTGSIYIHLDWHAVHLMTDVWSDIKLNAISHEHIDYPTQKPEELLERIIKASSNEGDTIADFWGGSGTTASVCQRLNRKWITCDKSEKSIEVIKARLFCNKSVKDKGCQLDVENAWN